MLRPYHDIRRGVTYPNHILNLQQQALDRDVVRVDLARHPPDTGRAIRLDRKGADRQVASPQRTARAAEGQKVAGHQHDHPARGFHTGAASSGSDREPPGTIIGKTLASSSITSPTSAGPGAPFACRSASVTSLAFLTRQPRMP